jgi:4-amino-4-deoxy-L-arabinose transferase-like glycosyltransferase
MAALAAATPTDLEPRVTRRLPPVPVTIGASLVLRLGFAWALGYGVDEGYAVTVARPFSLSYFDHPPLHFWMAGAMTWLSGGTTPIVVRLPFIGAFCLTLSLVADLTRRSFGESAARAATVLLAASGVLGITSATWVLPDGPLLCASVFAVAALARVVVPDDECSPADAKMWWLLSGAGFAVAMLSKYHAVLLLGGAGLYVFSDARARRHLRTPWPWFALLLAAAGLVPTLWWNAQHDWASFRFQGARAQAAHWSLAPFAEMLAGQIAWLFPWIVLPLVQGVRRYRGMTRVEQRARGLLLCTAAFPILAFSLIPLGGARGLPHWTAPGWLFVFPLTGAWVAARASAPITWPRWMAVGAIASVCLLVLVILHVRTDAIDRFLSPKARDQDPTRDAVSWSPAVAPADVYFARSWIQAGQVGVAIGAPARVHCLCTDPHHLAFRAAAPLRRGERGLLLERVRQRGAQPVATRLGGDSLRITLRDTVSLARGVRVARYEVTRR